ncbi:Wzz/FepE/Etk N-terminal domain-containing protein [Methylobacterium nodulans]|uniref:non-specific protein-tyrosine kinase n=1 Tax=Methylobacterium nodulans (strain LMG 21967 / CNCM I-2342 / ORS 2060) TaxID=460265 RepID=B8ISR4_METNO|nr:Wzz/FepE/Etk N-terminal domain-containing protein [Methylobacterium nodulans]ACL60713.1 lipopolysaccharide biosynthesis protein [Methylobacterium nodulans ORS 2060]
MPDRFRPQAGASSKTGGPRLAAVRPTVAKRISDPGDISYLIAVARRRWRIIAALTLAGIAVGGAYLALATPHYAATARILVDFRRLADIGQDQLAINNKVNDSAVDSQSTIMTSEGVLGAALRELKLDQDPEFIDDANPFERLLVRLGFGDPAPATEEERQRDAVEALLKRVKATRVGVSYVIEVRALSKEARKAARIANAIANAYLRDQLIAKQETAGSANDWYRARVADLQAQANEAEKAAVDYRAQHEIMLADGRFVDEQQLAELSSRLVGARSDRVQAEAKLDQIEAILRNGAEGAVADEFRNNVITALRQKQAQVRQRIADATDRFGPTHETVERARSELREIQNSIAEEFRRIAAGYRSDAAVAKLNEAAITRGLEDLAARSARAQTVRVELAQLQSVADTTKAMRDAFMSRFTEAAQEQSYPITEARIVSAAAAPARPAFPDPFRALVGGFAAGFGLGCALALGREVVSRRVRDREQLEAAVRRPCLAVIGEVPALARPRSPIEAALDEPLGAFAEALRAVRLGIDTTLPPEPGRNGIVLGVCSALPGEGATTVAANLASVLAAAGNPTLLIDMDLRRRRLSEILRREGRGVDGGLQDVLDGTAALRAVIDRRDLSGLHVLPGSAARDRLHPAERIASPALHTLLEAGRKGYRYVVLDLPPMLPVADARALAPLIDGFVLVTRWNHTTLEDLQNAVAFNPQVAGKLAGVVLNRADPVMLQRADDLVLIRSLAYLDETAGRQEAA